MTSIWGPLGWITLHSVSAAYPDRPTDVDKAILEQYLDAFAACITCPYCQRHFSDMLRTYKQRHPEWRNSKRDFMLAVFRMHNTVNRRLDKPIYSSVSQCIEALKIATRNAPVAEFRAKYITHVIRNWSSFQNSESIMALMNVRKVSRLNSEYWTPRETSFDSLQIEEGDVLENIAAIGIPTRVSQGFPTVTSGIALPKVGLRFTGGKLKLGGR